MSEKKKILLVDDDFDFLDQTKLRLQNLGYEVFTAESQEEGEVEFEKCQADLVVTDLMMENADGGFGLAYKVKKLKPETPVIIVTGVTHELGFKFNPASDEERSWIKADSLLNKPLRFEELKSEIEKYINS